jgi:hypothetical protein
MNKIKTELELIKWKKELIVPLEQIVKVILKMVIFKKETL